jgi:hypothetical protein
LSATVLALDCFCVDFFWFDLGDLSPIILLFFISIDSLWHEQFLHRHLIVTFAAPFVNKTNYWP